MSLRLQNRTHLVLLAGLLSVLLLALGMTSFTYWFLPTHHQLMAGPLQSFSLSANMASTSRVAAGLPTQPTVVHSTGPYGVVGKQTLTPDFINRVLASYHSPAAGKGQALYALGVKYGIDVAFALAFFGHESTFGTQGEATSSLSLGNLRCIGAGYEDLNPTCRDNYAWFDTWEHGFEAYYRLIRNLYVNSWGLVTVEQIIPKYAPPADNNNDDAYIASVEHEIDTWHAGSVRF